MDKATMTPRDADGRTDLITKYRPRTWEEVIGQGRVTRALRGLVEAGRSHAYLFTGPAGTGKTTLGRIVARSVGCDRANLVEVDAATNSGIDAMRAITDSLQFAALGGNGVRVVIVDEAHALSKPAWQALLKPIEEPPRGVYWVLCTTEPLKVPKTIFTRCSSFALKPVGSDEVYDLLVRVRDAEKLLATDDVLQLIAHKAEGSPRQALSNLAKCARCKDRAAAASLIEVAGEEGDVADLCRALVKGGLTWAKAMKLVAPLADQNAESVRHVIVAWLTKVAMGAKEDRRAVTAVNLLQAFASPYPASTSIYPLLLSLAEVVFSD